MTETTKPKRTRRFARNPKTNSQAGAETSATTGEGAAPASATVPEAAIVSAPTPSPAAKPESKSARVIALLQREEGATLEEMVAATGWLPHTTRAAMTGLKRKGYTITSAKADGVRRYHTSAAPTRVTAPAAVAVPAQ